jgi:hypothetical protein
MSYETKSSQQEQQQARVALEAKRVKLEEAESTAAAQAQQQQTRKALDVDQRHFGEGVTTAKRELSQACETAEAERRCLEGNAATVQKKQQAARQTGARR